MAPAAKMDYRKALLSTQEERHAEKACITKELEAKNILHKLTREIRDIIWRMLLLRPATIMPGYVRYNLLSHKKIGDHHYWTEQYQSRSYRYQWGERRQTEHEDSNNSGWTTLDPEYTGGYHNEVHQDLTITVTTEPTLAQAECIARGERALPFTFGKEFGSQVGCEVIHRGETDGKFPQVLNQIELSVPPLSSLSILQVNKQTLSECRLVLYGENVFSFSTGHKHNEFTHYPRWIPGMLKKDGSRQTPHQWNVAIDRMFTHDSFLPKFVARDPMLQFFHRIGRVNTSLLTRIKIEGHMKTVPKIYLDEPRGVEPIGFARILDILIIILRNVCPNLRELVLLMEDKIRNPDFKETMLWDDDRFNDAGKTDEQRIDEVVKKVVTGLESLKVLRLEGYHHFMSSYRITGEKSTPKFEDEWGRSARWMNVVEERASKRDADNAEEAKISESETKARTESAAGWKTKGRGNRRGQRRRGKGHRGQGN